MLLIIWSHLSQKTNTITTFGHFVFNLILFVQMGENILIICIFFNILIYSLFLIFYTFLPIIWIIIDMVHQTFIFGVGVTMDTKVPRNVLSLKYLKKKRQKTQSLFSIAEIFIQKYFLTARRGGWWLIFMQWCMHTLNIHMDARAKRNNISFLLFFLHTAEKLYFLFSWGDLHLYVESKPRPTFGYGPILAQPRFERMRYH